MCDTVEWIPATEDFIEADVIRWTEAIWSNKKRGRRRKTKNVPLGKQQVIGQITLIDEDFVSIKIIEAEVTEKECIKALIPHKKEDILRKKPSTLIKGGVERLPWSDEEARASLVREKNEK